jgi:nucleoside phosphorylase
MAKKKSVQVHSGAKPDDAPIATILLVFALPEERTYFHQTLTERESWTPATERQRYLCTYASKFGKVTVVVQTLDGMGQVESVLGATSAIVACSPTLVVMVGISGSLNDGVGLGDVVVSNQVKLYSSDKVMSLLPPDGAPAKYLLCDAGTARLPAAGGQILVDQRDRVFDHSFMRYGRNFIQSLPTDIILSGAEGALKKRPLKQLRIPGLPDKIQLMPSVQRERRVHMGWVLGTHHVVDSEEYRSYLVAKDTQLQLDVHRQKGEQDRAPWTTGEILAVDMESYGLIRSVELLRTTPAWLGGSAALIGGIVVRGISDLCTGKGELDTATGNEVRKLAVENATNICLTLIEELNYPKILNFK